MPQVPVAVRRERAARLRALGEERLARFLRGQIGAVRSLLVERDGSGHTEHFARARFDPPGVVERGRIVPVRVVDADGGSLIVRAEA
jgi:threonylcarbamoyladenosine tRNA methylthiotransferase MtaB